MTNWNVIRDLDKMVQEKYPDLSQDEQVAIVWKAYNEIEYRLLMGPSEPVGILSNYDFSKLT